MADTNYYIDLDAVTNGDGSIGSPLITFPASDALASTIADGDRVIFNVSGVTQYNFTAVWNIAAAAWSGPGELIFVGDQPDGNVISVSHARMRLWSVTTPVVLPNSGGVKVTFQGIGVYWNRNGDGECFKHNSFVAGMGFGINDCPVRSLYPAASAKPQLYAIQGDSSVACTLDVARSSFGAGFSRLFNANYGRALVATIDKISAAEFTSAFGTINATATVSLTDSAIVSCPSYTNVDTVDNCATTTGTGTNAVTIADFSGEFTSLTAGSEDFTLQGDSALLYAGSDGNHIGSDQAAEVAPSFTTQPSAGSIVEGDAGSEHTFTVVAVGPPLVTAYQWYKDDVEIVGATSNTLTVAGDEVTIADSGSEYECDATNSVGTTRSTAGVLTVTSAAYLITPPAQMRRGEAFDVTITTAGTAPDMGDSAEINGIALTLNSVTGTGPDYTLNITVPLAANIQYNDTGWPIAFTIDGVSRNSSVIPFLPPTDHYYADLTDPEAAGTAGTAFAGGDVNAQVGGQVEWYKVSGTYAGDFTVDEVGQWIWDPRPGESVVMAFRYIAPDGTLEAFSNATFTAAGDNVPANPGNQSLTNQEPSTRVYFTPFEITGADPGEPIPSSLIAGSQAEWQVSTDGGETYDTSTSGLRTLYSGNFVRPSIVTGPDFANVGANSTAAASINMNGVIVQLSATNRNAVVPTITQHVSNQSVTAGATATFGYAATGGTSRQWYENISGTDTTISGSTSNPLVINNPQLADSGRQFFAIETSPEGGTARTPASGYVALTVVAQATRLQLPSGLRDVDGSSLAGQTITVDVHAADTANSRVGAFLYRTTVLIPLSGPANIDNNQNGAAGIVRAVCRPQTSGLGTSVPALFIAVQAVP